MPVQINEVVIRTTVDTGVPSAPGGDNRPSDAREETCAEEELLERLLQILQESKER